MPDNKRKISNNVTKNTRPYKGKNIKARVGVAAATIGLAVGMGLNGAISGIRDSFKENKTIEEAIQLAAQTNTIYELEQGVLEDVNDAGLKAEANYLTNLINEYTNLKQVEAKGEMSFDQETRLMQVMQEISPELVQNVKQGILRKKIANACGIETFNNVNINVSKYTTPNGQEFNQYQVLANGQELRIDERLKSLIDQAYFNQPNMDASSKEQYAESIEGMVKEYNEFSGNLLDNSRILEYQNGEITFRDRSYSEQIKNVEESER